MAKKNKIPTVAVGMSGGVDSTVTAYLLKKQGFRVIGLTMKLSVSRLKFLRGMKGGCFGPGQEKSIADARAAAKKIGIPHYVVELGCEFKKEVIEYFRREYLSGRTPNPCVMCNRKIKFGLMLQKAKEAGAEFDYFATGHYARTALDKKTGRCLLKKGADGAKDQSYFLSQLTQNQLKRVIFPLGCFHKREIKKIAAEAGFKKYAVKRESQDFIGGRYELLFKKNEIKPGNITGLDGAALGRHRGIIYYTIGQRRGLNIGGTPEPVFVVKIVAAKNRVVVGPKQAVFSTSLDAKDMNWITFDKPPAEISAMAKIRQQGKEFSCRVFPLPGSRARVIFDEPQHAVTPGQAVAFYKKDTVLGGGIIAGAGHIAGKKRGNNIPLRGTNDYRYHVRLSRQHAGHQKSS